MRFTRTSAALAVGALLAVTGVTVAAAAPPPSSNFTSVVPVRILDTRTDAPVAADATLSLPVAGANGVPADATAVVLNVTVVTPQADGHLTVYPDGVKMPLASNANFTGTQHAVANEVTVDLLDGKVDIYNSSSGTVQLVVDLEGWYSAAPAPYTPPASVSKSFDGIASVTTGGKFSDNASEVGTVNLKAGTYQFTVNAKATPLMTSDVQVFPQFFVYAGPKPASGWAGDLFNVGSGALESGGHTNIDSYFDGTGTITLAADTTLYLYAFGYDSDTNAGSYALDSLSVTAVPIG